MITVHRPPIVESTVTVTATSETNEDEPARRRVIARREPINCPCDHRSLAYTRTIIYDSFMGPEHDWQRFCRYVVYDERRNCWLYTLDKGATKFYDLLQLVEFYQLNSGSLPTRLTHYVQTGVPTPIPRPEDGGASPSPADASQRFSVKAESATTTTTNRIVTVPPPDLDDNDNNEENLLVNNNNNIRTNNNRNNRINVVSEPRRATLNGTPTVITVVDVIENHHRLERRQRYNLNDDNNVHKLNGNFRQQQQQQQQNQQRRSNTRSGCWNLCLCSYKWDL
ncbi:hypothetical protein M0802_003985 [Mischocyttarus mexicanus]|nr:hypothetical protein M0802_003985 [Mischocyttarus mexicanus]